MGATDYKKVTLTFGLEYIFDVARLRSAQIANHIKAENGTQEGSLAITEAERDLWNVSIRYPANKIYDYLITAGKKMTGTYEFGISDAAGKKVIVYVLYIHHDWDENLTRGLHDMIERALVSGGLSDWYKSTLSDKAFAMCNEEYETSLRECKGNINKRKHATVRNHITF